MHALRMTAQMLPAGGALKILGAERGEEGSRKAGDKRQRNATQRTLGEKVKLEGFRSKERRGREAGGGREGEKKEQKVAVSCTWLETTHLRYT